jgi:hypothetical protein
METTTMDEDEDWKGIAGRCFLAHGNIDVQIQSVDIGHQHRLAVIIQRML